jgi:type VI secretion system protein ImpM
VSGEADPVLSDAAPGWFGKLPGMDDFAHRRLPESFREAWGRWLHNGLARLRVRHQDRIASYLEAPLWCFVLGNDVIDGQCWIGILMPSVGGTGRHFPFTMAAELVSPRSELTAEALARVRQWWRLASQAVREGWKGDLDAIRFEVLLHRLFTHGAHGDEAAGDEGEAVLALPEVGQSLWFTDPTAEGGLGMASRGLPEDDQFEALFGCGPGGSASGAEAL